MKLVTIKRRDEVRTYVAASLDATKDVYVIKDADDLHYFEPKAGCEITVEPLPVDPNPQ